MAQKQVSSSDWEVRTPQDWMFQGCSLNAKTARNWAEQIAQEEDVPTIDVLLRWIQNIPSMRIRRAIDTELKETHKVDIKPNKI